MLEKTNGRGRRAVLTSVFGVTAAAVLLASGSAVHAAEGDAPADSLVVAGDVREALGGLDAGLLTTPDRTVSDADSVGVSEAGGVAVDMPDQADDGVTIDTGAAPAVTIGLPDQASGTVSATAVAPGTVAYLSDTGAATAVRASASGGVQMLTVITSPDAPTHYTYRLDIPAGGSVAVTESGSAVVVDDMGVPFISVDVPWAQDAVGRSVPTHFEVNDAGDALTQVVEHSADFTLPITADPNWGRGFRISAWKTWNFLQCIMGVGVPIGVGWAILTNAGVATAVARLTPGAVPASWGGAAHKYLGRVSRACGVALR